MQSVQLVIGEHNRYLNDGETNVTVDSIFVVSSLSFSIYQPFISRKLEDLKVLRRSPDLLNNVKICQGQLQLIME